MVVVVVVVVVTVGVAVEVRSQFTEEIPMSKTFDTPVNINFVGVGGADQFDELYVVEDFLGRVMTDNMSKLRAEWIAHRINMYEVMKQALEAIDEGDFNARQLVSDALEEVGDD